MLWEMARVEIFVKRLNLSKFLKAAISFRQKIVQIVLATCHLGQHCGQWTKYLGVYRRDFVDDGQVRHARQER